MVVSEMRYDVTVDYTTTTTITVEAPDEEAAENAVYDYVSTPEGQEDMLRRMAVCRNIPEGIEVACVEEARPNVPLLFAR